MEEIQVFDWKRIFLGDYPIAFLLEIVFRTVIMYLYTIFLLRFLGKRGMSQLSNLEVAIIISFGSAVGDPMIGANIPIIYGITAITTVALIQKGMEKFINKNPTAEKVMEGVPDCLVDNGIVMLHKLSAEGLSREDLFRSLRIKNVFQLGEVNKAYFETSGDMTVLVHEPRNVKPGLCILPDDEHSPSKLIIKKNEVANANHAYCCTACGFSKDMKIGAIFPECPHCGNEEWTKASFKQ